MFQANAVRHLRRNQGAWVVALVLCVLYVYFIAFKALVEIEVKIESPYPSYVKVYWAKADGAYSEQNMRRVLITPYQQKYNFFLTNLRDVSRLRIDPLEYQGQIRIDRFKVTQLGYDEIDLATAAQLSRLKPLSEIDSLYPADDAVIVMTAGEDGQLELAIIPQQNAIFPQIHILNLFLIIIAVLALSRFGSTLYSKYYFVPSCLMIVLVLATTMVAFTDLGVHPDEKAHLDAVIYYGENLLPPPIDSPEAANSFSAYGYSRLANFEFYYQAAGYFSAFLSPFNLSSLLSARIFGLAILASMLLMAAIKLEFRIFALPLLISAQTWYMFSYTNSDGFALTIATFASYQAGYKNSQLNRLLSQSSQAYLWPRMILFGILFGLLLLLKSNFYFFLLFLGMYLVWRLSIGDYPNRKILWSRLIVMSLIGVSVYGGRVGLDYVANGPNPPAVKAAMVEQHANQIYKPSTPLNHKHIYLYLKDRGFSLDRILIKEQWAEKTFLSAFGAYGFTQFFASTTYFELVRYTGITLIGLIFLGVLIHGPPSVQVLFVLVVVSALMLVAMLLWRSWTVSFQPQGRYLAPILPMLGVLYYHTRQYLNEKVIMALVGTLFLLSVYSFIFVGLYEIPKTGYL